MKFIIDRSKWRCGGDSEPNQRGLGKTQLLNAQGFQCCLGQICEQLGISPNQILDIAEPLDLDFSADASLEAKIEPLAFYLGDGSGAENTFLAIHAININDDPNIVPAEREKMLALAFAEQGHEIEFVGEYGTTAT